MMAALTNIRYHAKKLQQQRVIQNLLSLFLLQLSGSSTLYANNTKPNNHVKHIMQYNNYNAIPDSCTSTNFVVHIFRNLCAWREWVRKH